ncbi:hypothetical protein FRB95_013531 [Tulasnella sp. JGI-2019a]|nr:hypothetical protein FRB93_008262 [Tulasnella sp. JGI-2019a]KAG9034249.1 hypothetical protein FRB95_013531 [Tulasnella sp. JGI-2019a]
MSHHPRFKVLAGPSYKELKELPVNVDTKDGSPYFNIKTPDFEGRIVGNIKGFVDENGNVCTSKYFDRKDRTGTTWSIQIQGRFLKPVTANDVLFGNTFDGPLKLPWGTTAALQFASFVDPVLNHDLACDRPWALSPMISTMPHFKATHQPPSTPILEFDPLAEFNEDISGLFKDSSAAPNPLPQTASQRQKYFQDEELRKSIEFTPEVVLHVDFAYGYFQFPELYLTLPGGISFDLKKYWSNQPVRFVCCQRASTGTGPGKEYFVVQFDVPELGPHEDGDEDQEELETDVPTKTGTKAAVIDDKALADDID